MTNSSMQAAFNHFLSAVSLELSAQKDFDAGVISEEVYVEYMNDRDCAYEGCINSGISRSDMAKAGYGC